MALIAHTRPATSASTDTPTAPTVLTESSSATFAIRMFFATWNSGIFLFRADGKSIFIVFFPAPVDLIRIFARQHGGFAVGSSSDATGPFGGP